MKYKLLNIDCASCASNIEGELKKQKEFNSVTVNSATGILSIDSNDKEKIQKIIKSVEPRVTINELNNHQNSSTKKSHRVKLELFRIAAVLCIYILGIIFKDELSSTKNSWAEYAVFLSAYLLSGYTVLKKAFLNILRGKIFDENFLMSIATIGAILIHELHEAVAVMWFYNVGEFIENIAVKKSRRSVKSLLEIRPQSANLFKNGQEIVVDPSQVNIGEEIFVKPGEKIPLDGVVKDGSSLVDTYPLTGESIPKEVETGSSVFAGTINKSNLLKIKVTKNYEDSSVAKILELVESASDKKAESERFITTFARYYTPVIVLIASVIAFVPPIFFSAENFSDWIYRALVILVISCPCALVISIPLGYFGGIGGASRKGILVKGSNFIDALANTKTIVFDKTGTLTKGVFQITEVVTANSANKNELLSFAKYAEYHSSHPIAVSVKNGINIDISPEKIKNYKELSGRGVIANVDGSEIIAGNDRLLHEENILHEKCDIEGTVLHVAVNKKYLGYIVISDILKTEAQESINLLKQKYDINDIVIFSGDNDASVKYMANQLNLNNYYSELLPEDKVDQLEKILSDKNRNGKVGFVGDGINDSPVITRADVGIAMGALGSDAAIEAADVVIMTDSLKKIPEAIGISRRTKKIVWQNIVFALSVKAVFILMGSFGLATMWEAVFADMGVALLAILNAARVIRIN